MAGLGIDGLASGLDTTALVKSLVAVDAVQQTRLRTQLTTLTKSNSSFQTLNGLVAAVATKAKAVGAPDGVAATVATSSSPAVAVTSSASARPGSMTVSVGQLATAQVAVTDGRPAWRDTAPSLVLTTGGVATPVTPASGSMPDVAAAINAAATGITAVAIPLSTVDGVTSYRLQLSAAATGEQGAFDLTEDGVTTLSEVTPARDATLTLWAGSAAAYTRSSSTNTFTDVLPGVSLTATGVADPVTITVGRDAQRSAATASGLVAGVAAALSYIATNSATTSTTDAAGRTTTAAGTLTGDATARQTAQQLTAALTQPVGRVSPSSIGITLDAKGAVAFDAARFEAALAADPSGTLGMVSAISARVASAASTLSDPTVGVITARVTGTRSVMTDLDGRIESWDTRLAARQASLEKQFAALETTLSTLKSQSTWLSGALGSLISYSGSTS